MFGIARFLLYFAAFHVLRVALYSIVSFWMCFNIRNLLKSFIEVDGDTKRMNLINSNIFTFLSQ